MNTFPDKYNSDTPNRRPLLTGKYSGRVLNSTVVLLRMMALTCFFLTGVGFADSTAPAVTTKISNTTVQVAEPLSFEITVITPVGSKVDFPSIAQSLGDFDVTDQSVVADVPSASVSNERLWTQRMTLESIVTGDREIPSLEIQVRRDGELLVLRTDAIPIRVASVLEDRADPSKFRDIRSVVDIAVPEPVSWAWVWWTGGSTGGIIVTALMLVNLRKRRSWMTPSVWALRELDQLRFSNVMRSSDSERVTEALSSILRDYLQMQFNIAAPIQTTSELLQSLDSSPLISPDSVRVFTAIFQNADLARFAGLKLSSEELVRAIDDTQRLIKQSSKEFDKTETGFRSRSESSEID